MPFIKLIILLIIVFSSSHNIKAEEEETDHDYLESWNNISLNKKWGEEQENKIQLTLSPVFRLSGKEANESTLRAFTSTAIYSRQLTDNWSVGIGYSHVFRSARQDINRIILQVAHQDNIKKWNIQNQARVEEQYFQNFEELYTRLRYRLKVSHPINKREDLHFFISNEIFLTPMDDNDLFNQNRLITGISKKINEHITLDTGYILNHVRPFNLQDKHLNQGLYTNLNFSF